MEHDIIYNIKDFIITEIEAITESYCTETSSDDLTMDVLSGKYDIELYCGATNFKKEQKIHLTEFVKQKFGITDCYVKFLSLDIDDDTGDIYGFNIIVTVEI